MTVLYPAATAGSRTTGVGVAAATIRGAVGRRGVPASIPVDELFFWTRVWQEGEKESETARAAGEVHEFQNGRDAVSWLLADD